MTRSWDHLYNYISVYHTISKATISEKTFFIHNSYSLLNDHHSLIVTINVALDNKKNLSRILLEVNHLANFLKRQDN